MSRINLPQLLTLTNLPLISLPKVLVSTGQWQLRSYIRPQREKK